MLLLGGLELANCGLMLALELLFLLLARLGEGLQLLQVGHLQGRRLGLQLPDGVIELDLDKPQPIALLDGVISLSLAFAQLPLQLGGPAPQAIHFGLVSGGN